MSGRAWVYGDKIDTDILAPGWAMKLDADALASHCLAAVDPGFASGVAVGDVVIGGEDFGIGSSREQAAISLKQLGVAAVMARSFARIFYRNAINIGLPAVQLPPDAAFEAGDSVSFDLAAGVVRNETRDSEYAIAPMPGHLREMIAAGGMMNMLKRRFGQNGD